METRLIIQLRPGNLLVTLTKVRECVTAAQLCPRNLSTSVGNTYYADPNVCLSKVGDAVMEITKLQAAL